MAIDTQKKLNILIRYFRQGKAGGRKSFNVLPIYSNVKIMFPFCFMESIMGLQPLSLAKCLSLRLNRPRKETTYRIMSANVQNCYLVCF